MDWLDLSPLRPPRVSRARRGPVWPGCLVHMATVPSPLAVAVASGGENGSRRAPLPFVSAHGVRLHSAIPSQASEDRTSDPYSVGAWGRGLAVSSSWPAKNVTFPLEAHVDIVFRREAPRLQDSVPGGPCGTCGPAYQQHGFGAVGKENIGEAFGPRDCDHFISQPGHSHVPQREMPSGQSGQLAWLDNQQSWLDWADISLDPLPPDGKPLEVAEGTSGGGIDLDIALDGADQAVPDLESEPYSADIEQARWGSDPAFRKGEFVPRGDQLSEREVASIWEGYVATSLKPFVNVRGSSISPRQVIIVGHHPSDAAGFHGIKPPPGGTRRSLPAPVPGSMHPKRIENDNITSTSTSTIAVPRRGPLPPFRGGRKRPMPPRIRPFALPY